MSEVAEEKWTLDRKVNLSFILALLGQTIVGVAFFTSQYDTLEQSIKDIAKLETRLQEQELKSRHLNDSLVRLEEQSKTQTRILERIEKKLDGPN